MSVPVGGGRVCPGWSGEGVSRLIVGRQVPAPAGHRDLGEVLASARHHDLGDLERWLTAQSRSVLSAKAAAVLNGMIERVLRFGPLPCAEHFYLHSQEPSTNL